MKRTLTEGEVELIRSKSDKSVHHLLDLLPCQRQQCWDCSLFSLDHGNYGKCKEHGQVVPVEKRKEAYECFQPREEDPF